MEVNFFRLFVLCVALLSHILLSCVRSNTDNCIRPYSSLEKDFIASLHNSGNKVEIFRFNYPNKNIDIEDCIMYETTQYRVEIVNKDLINNVDTMRVLADSIVTYLYTNLIEDSILYYSSDFEISFFGKKTDSFQYKSNLVFIRNYDKINLENYCEFEVIRENNVFRRRIIKNKIDSLICTEMGSVF